jgi:hypothetical protein
MLIEITKLKGDAIEPNSVTSTQISTDINTKLTAAYDQANAAYEQANTGGGGTTGGFSKSFLMAGL